MKSLLIACLCLLANLNSFGQKTNKPFECGFAARNVAELKNYYDRSYKTFGVKEGETVASVGAKNGYVEVQIACFVDNVNWTIQDIDTTCLNEAELQKIIKYDEGLIAKPIKGQFNIVIGKMEGTNLPRNHYDRLLLSQVYHELTEKKKMLLDIHEAIKQNGLLVILERMGTKRGQRHGDCGLPKLWEPDFILEMKDFGFELVNKTRPEEKLPLIYYVFKKA